MSIKNLFNKQAKTVKSAASSSVEIESSDYSYIFEERNETFIPFIDFSSASNFAKFGSAEEYYKNTIERIHNDYPYDGSFKEKILFELSSSYLDKYILENRYPKTNGYINLSYNGWGTQTSIDDGYGLSNTNEYIFVRGGIHTYNQVEKISKVFDKSIKYDSDKQRTTSLRINPSDGLTVEFWLKKSEFDTSKTEKEVILDLWNGNQSASADYGRFTLALTSSQQTDGTNTFIVTMQSGTNGFFEQSLGTSTVTTASLSNWHHYAFSFVSQSAGIMSRIYVDGDLNESSSLGTTGLNEIGGLINGYIGALQTSPSSSFAPTGSGKLSASLDEFRYWKKRRTSREIYNNWYKNIGGGTNTDLANVYLGFYYKFNEGVVGDSTIDSKVLDYSGRLANGTWTGYESGARSTNSAFVESGLVTSEEKDPIIYSTHPDVSSLKETLMAQGKIHDNENNGMLYHKVPRWVQREDEETGFATKKLYQIIASYFDNLYQQITFLPSLKNKVYPSSSYKALPFADKLLEEKGMYVSDLFGNASVLEYFSNKDQNKIQFEKRIHDIKNQIYTNIYNNLENIYKEKGTEGGIRNMLRCFGIDDELVKLNIYTDKGKHYFTDAFKHTNIKKKFIDFNKKNNLEGTIFQTSSSAHSLTYISGSGEDKKERYNALTSEVSIIFPKKKRHGEPGHFLESFVSSSIFGLHQAITSSSDYSWSSDDVANFQVYAVKEDINSDTAKFILRNYEGSISMETGFYKEVYANEKWNLAVRIKPEDYPIAGNVVTSSNRNYVLEFYGVSHAFDTVKEEFLLSSTLNYETGSSYLSNPKRFYVGAHRQNFTGSTLQKSDIQAGRFNLWYDYISDDTLRLHNRDITSKGTEKLFRSSTIFGQNLQTTQVPSIELLVADWDFETVSVSDGSGRFIVEDGSSGSADSRYGWMDNIIRREHRASGFGFPASKSNVVLQKIVNSSKKELPEISYSSDRVQVMGEEKKYFIEDEDVSDNFYSLEKSMYQIISEEMLKTLSTAQIMSNLIGETVDRYRVEYKKLNHIRRIFFENVEEEPDFDKFTEYFKWIDSSVSFMISQLFPVSVRFSKGISDVVESHLFERNKYQNKFPLISTHTSTEGSIVGVGQSKYQWQFGHAPLEGGDNNNCLWQKERAERRDIQDRETIKNIIANRNNAQATILGNKDRSSYSGSTFAIRRFSQPLQLNSVISQTIHGGINYSLQKDRDYIWTAVNRHSDLTSVGVPKNVLVVGAGPGQGIELPSNTCNDIEDPNEKKKFNTTVFVGKFAGGGNNGDFEPVSDEASYTYAVRGKNKLPFNIFSGSVATGYNSSIQTGYKSDAVLTNIHSDTTDFSNDIPMQGPFTRQWVGGHQSRHIDLNRYDANLIDGETFSSTLNNLQNKHTRPEAWRLLVVEAGGDSDGALGLTEPQYGVTAIDGHPNSGSYPDVAKKSATLYRDLRTKRPVNISNIQTTTSSVNHGNYHKKYEIVNTTGRKTNNLFFKKNSDTTIFLPNSIKNILPETTNYQSLAASSIIGSGNVFGVHENNRQNGLNIPTVYTASNSKAVITSRFSSPGGPDVQSYGFLDAYSQEYSVYNNLNYRNLSVRGVNVRTTSSAYFHTNDYYNLGGSGEEQKTSGSSPIRMNNHLGERDGLKTLLSRRCYKFGLDSKHAIDVEVIPGARATGSFYLRSRIKALEGDYLQFGQISLPRFTIEASTDGNFEGGAPRTAIDTGSLADDVSFWNLVKSSLIARGWDTEYRVLTQSADINISASYFGGSNFVKAISSSMPSVFSLPNATDRYSSFHFRIYASGSGASPATTETGYLFSQYNNTNYGVGNRVQQRAAFIDQNGHLKIVFRPIRSNSMYHRAGKQYDNFFTGRTGRWIDVGVAFAFQSGSTPSYNDFFLYVDGVQVVHSSLIDDSNVIANSASEYTAHNASEFYILSDGNLTHAENNGDSALTKIHVSEFAYFTGSSNVFTETGMAAIHKQSQHYDYSHNNRNRFLVSWIKIGNHPDDFINGTLLAPGELALHDTQVPSHRFGSNDDSLRYVFKDTSQMKRPDFARFYLTASQNGVAYNNFRFESVSSRSGLTTFLKSGGNGIGADNNGIPEGYWTYQALEGGIDDILPPNIPKEGYITKPSFHKQQRNENRRPHDTSVLEGPILVTKHDNAYINSPIPRSDFQYKWVTSSLGNNYSVTSGKQRMYGYAHPTGIMSSSVLLNGERGFVPAITFPSASEIFGDM